MMGQYKDNQPHGKQTKWSPGGRLILEMHFQNGNPHGLATSWDETGKLVEQAEFFEGRQVNFDESSKANAIPATAKKIESTNSESSLR